MKTLFAFHIDNRSFLWGLIIIGIIVIFSTIGPLFSPYAPQQQNLTITLQAPSGTHWLGTDYYGRDILVRLMAGGKTTLGIALSSTIIAVIIGLIVGLLSGYIGGWLDTILMRFVDIMLGFPRLFIILLVIGMGYTSIGIVILILALFSWMDIARIVRSEVLSKKELAYVKSAKAIGLKHYRILLKHILPNILGPMIVAAVLLISTIIIVESSLSFLGLGVQAPVASWGNILTDGKIDPIGTWWISVSSGLLIIFSVIGFNLIGEGANKFNERHI